MQVAVAVQGLMVVASVAVPALLGIKPFPTATLLFFGLMVMTGGELLDPKLHRFVITSRFVGATIALLGGFVLRFIV